MNIYFTSDLHLEFGISPRLESQLSTASGILILAGDISTVKCKDNAKFFDLVSRTFDTVIYIPGNHEYYGSSLLKATKSLKEQLEPYPNILFGETLQHENIVAATLWTDFGRNPVSMEVARHFMNDYSRIKNDIKYRKLIPQDVLEIHLQHLQFLEDTITEGSIVVTHHAPAALSVAEQYRHEHNVNDSYYTNLEDLIFRKKPKYWIHGHMHDPVKYQLHDTVVWSNPRGYYNHETNDSNFTLKKL